MVDNLDLSDNLNNIFKVLEKEYNLVPTLNENHEYKRREAEYLNELLNDEKLVEKNTKICRKECL